MWLACKLAVWDKEIQKVMVTLDVRENTVAEAIEKGVNLIIAKHQFPSS